MENETTTKLIPNAIYNWSKGNGQWAKHGTVYTREINGNLYVINTYEDSSFGIGSQSFFTNYNPQRYEDEVVFIGMIDDFREVGKYEFDLYKSEDKLYIPIGMRSEKRYVRKDAIKQVDYIKELLEHKIQQANHRIKTLQQDIVNWNDWLSEIENDPEFAKWYDNSDYSLPVQHIYETRINSRS